MSSDEASQYSSYQSQIAQSSQSSGVQGAGQQMQTASTAGQSANNLAAGVCANKQAICNNTCSPLVNKYQALVQNCNGCDSSSVYESTLSALRSKSNQCGQLSAAINNMTTQSASNMANALGGATSAASGSSGSQDGSGDVSASNGQGSAKAMEQGSASFTTATPSNKQQNFNLADTSAVMAGQMIQGAGQNRQQNLPTVNPVANNSGGQMPGGNSPQAGRPNAANAAPRVAAAASNIADIDQGLRSGGGGSFNNSAGGGMDMPDASSPYFGNRGSGRAPASAQMDLRQFLPGGQRDPNMRNVGGQAAAALGIHGRFVDIWARISDRMQEKCRLGELMGCR
jgi:hypothetical protein